LQVLLKNAKGFFYVCKNNLEYNILNLFSKPEGMGMVKIGIPRALFYYVYYPKWESFFQALDTEVICSGNTTKIILDEGVREAIADACVPVKIFFGHALALKDKVDFLFIPRIVCTNKKNVYCPKFLGLPDMIRHGLPDMPPIIDVRVDTRAQKFAVWKAYQHIGKFLGKSNIKTFNAYRLANRVHRRFIKLLLSGYQPTEAISVLKNKNLNLNRKHEGELTFALLGYPYTINDPYVSVQLINKLKKMGINVLTTENIPLRALNRQKINLQKNFFWTFSDRVMRAAKYYFESGVIDGAIHLTAFGCGPDSLLNNFIEREVKKYPAIPFMTLTIDEHSGEAGITTRLEAFIDMVKRKQRGVFNAQ